MTTTISIHEDRIIDITTAAVHLLDRWGIDADAQVGANFAYISWGEEDHFVRVQTGSFGDSMTYMLGNGKAIHLDGTIADEAYAVAKHVAGLARA